MDSSADIALIGGGAGGLQLSLESLRLLEQHGFAFSIGTPPVLTTLLSAHGVELERLDNLVAEHADTADALLAAADVILKQVEIERPVLVLVPGNPMMLNSLSRFLMAEGQRRELTVERLAGISTLDVVINELGIDVAARGLQVFAAQGVVDGRSMPSPDMPTVILGLGGIDADLLDQLTQTLSGGYRGDHGVTLVNVGPDGATSHATGPLSSLGEFAEHLHSGSSFFIGPTSR